MRRNAVIALVVSAAATPCFATPRIESVSVRPNPVPFTAGGLGDVVIAVSIERPTPIDLRCEAVIDPGDGGAELHLTWNLGDSRTKTARYEYRKAGTYKLTVSGSGSNACTGARELAVKVGGRGPAQPVALENADLPRRLDAGGGLGGRRALHLPPAPAHAPAALRRGHGLLLGARRDRLPLELLG